MIWHGSAVTLDEAGSRGLGLVVAKVASYAVVYDLLLLAVPVLLITSMYLFLPRAAVRGTAYVVRRCGRLIGLYAFWLGLQVLASLMLTPHASVRSTRLEWLWTGGPDVAGAGSVLYFLLDLALITALAGFYVRLSNRAQVVVGACLLGTSFVWFEWAALRGVAISLTNPLQCVVYIPLAAVALSVRWDRNALLGAWAVFLLAVVAEGALRGLALTGTLTYHVSVYARIAGPLGALALLATFARWRPHPDVARGWLARYSLGVYAIHKPVLALTALALPLTWFVGAARVRYQAGGSVAFVAGCALTVLIVAVLGVTPLRRVVS